MLESHARQKSSLVFISGQWQREKVSPENFISEPVAIMTLLLKETFVWFIEL